MVLPVARISAYLLVAALAASTVVAPWPVLRNGWARLTGASAVYAVGTGYDEWAQRVIWLTGFLLVAIVVGARTPWLGAAVALVGCNVFLRSQTGSEAVLFAFIALGVALVKAAPETHRLLAQILVGAAIFQCAYVFCQWLGVDYLRGTAQMKLLGWETQATGTLGNRGAVGALLAIAAPLAAPVWLPFLIAGVFLTKSMGALIALGVGLAVQYRHVGLKLKPHTILADYLVRINPAMIGVTLGAILFATFYRGNESLWLRLSAYKRGFLDWTQHALVFGHGLGGWTLRDPARLTPQEFISAGGAWVPAHNDPLQWAYEFGLVGVVVLGGFLASERRMFTHPHAAGACASLAVVSLVTFPFHAVTTALAGALLIGIGTTPLRQGA